MIQHARAAALTLFRSVGAFDRTLDSEWRRERLLILCYHGISLLDEHRWHPQLYFTPDAFRRRLDALAASRASVLPLGEALDRLAAGTLPRRSVVLTFDDGAYNFVAGAVPLLESAGYPATVYLSTHYCETQLPVFPALCSYLLWKSGVRELAPWPELGLHVAMPAVGYAAQSAIATHLHAECNRRGFDSRQKDEVARELAQRINVDDTQVREQRLLHLMSADEVQDVARRGFDVQLHTHRHGIPDRATGVEDEIDPNRRITEGLTGRAATHFCYPSGKYTASSVQQLRALGITSATTCDVALARRDHDPLLLPRFVDTMQQSELMFQAWVSGVAEWTSRNFRMNASVPNVVPPHAPSRSADR